MKQIETTYPDDKTFLYRLLRTQLTGLIDGVPHLTANLANISALLGGAMKDINWVGFYLLQKDALILGPFQGKPACVEIQVGNGVCGTAAAEDRTLLVPDVHAFPGHIACDSASNSEIVIPIHCDEKVIGVLDIDSPLFHRFDKEDQCGLEQLVHTLEQMLREQFRLFFQML